ncbi:MAG: hypothetical protein ACSLFE_08255 [Gemmatimonadaceae bacterium]
MPGVNSSDAVLELVRSSEFLIQKVERLEIQAHALTHALLMTSGALADAKEAVRAVKHDLSRIAATDPAADARTIAAAISENEQPAESGRSLNS